MLILASFHNRKVNNRQCIISNEKMKGYYEYGSKICRGVSRRHIWRKYGGRLIAATLGYVVSFQDKAVA